MGNRHILFWSLDICNHSVSGTSKQKNPKTIGLCFQCVFLSGTPPFLSHSILQSVEGEVEVFGSVDYGRYGLWMEEWAVCEGNGIVATSLIAHRSDLKHDSI